MTDRASLSQPIRGDVARDGRLVFADDMLQRLHYRAGGCEGGVFSIPGLAALATLTLRLKMRLSRAVMVADDDENMELWVDAIPDGEIARLSIISWRSSPAKGFAQEAARRDQNFATIETGSVLLFDDSQRLLSAAGDMPAYLDRTDFGKSATDILTKIVRDPEDVAAMVDAMQANRDFNEIATHGDGSMSGNPHLSRDGVIVGYRCQLHALDPTSARSVSKEASFPGVLFGRQLAPVLQQPLDRIIASAETIGGEFNGPVRQNYALYAKDIANAARHLVALVDDLGDVEAVEGPDFIVARDNIELGDIARSVASLLALKAADHSIRIVAPSDAIKVPAVAEFRRVLQILINLVTNAIRYSPDGTEITIEIAEWDDASVIMVSDQGVGITEGDRELVFEKFERLGRSGDGGSGLGLYISRKLVRAMGGDLTVDAAPGSGAVFTLRLPSN